MSRSNNTELVSPCKKYFQWSSDNKCLRYFDKNIGEKGDNVNQSIPFTFLVLDVLQTITGYSESEKSGIWSNEIKDIKKDVFTVKSKNGIIAKGLYAEIKDKLEKLDAKYGQSVYIAYYNESKELEIANIKLSGAGLGAWFDFSKRVDKYKVAITIDTYSTEKKGKNEYYVPVFKARKISEQTDKQAIELDKVLQEYLVRYFNRSNGIEEIDQSIQSQESEFKPSVSENSISSDLTDDNDDLPF